MSVEHQAKKGIGISTMMITTMHTIANRLPYTHQALLLNSETILATSTISGLPRTVARPHADCVVTTLKAKLSPLQMVDSLEDGIENAFVVTHAATV